MSLWIQGKNKTSINLHQGHELMFRHRKTLTSQSHCSCWVLSNCGTRETRQHYWTRYFHKRSFWLTSLLLLHRLTDGSFGSRFSLDKVLDWWGKRVQRLNSLACPHPVEWPLAHCFRRQTFLSQLEFLSCASGVEHSWKRWPRLSAMDGHLSHMHHTRTHPNKQTHALSHTHAVNNHRGWL